MADTDLPPTGAETKITITLGGTPVAIVDQIDGFTADQLVEEIEHKPIGTHTVHVDKVPKGWRGTISFKKSTSGLDEVIDTLDAARRNNTPSITNITRTTHYRDGSSTTYVYPDVKLDLGGDSTRRGEYDNASINWRTGLARIAL